LDSEFIKMHAASLRIRSEYLPSFIRELYFGRATSPIADTKSAMIEKRCEDGKAMEGSTEMGDDGLLRRSSSPKYCTWNCKNKTSRSVNQIRCSS
jgi:hypothetical protein